MAQQWILVTGGSRGIGRALVTGLAQSGNVVFTGRDEAAINATRAASEIPPTGYRDMSATATTRRGLNSLRRRYWPNGGHRKRLSTMPG